MLKEMVLNGSDYSYILGREFVIFSNGVTMSIEEFKIFHSKGILVKKIMSLARVPKRLSDYRVALETGIMTPVYMPVRTMQLNTQRPKGKRVKREKEITVTDYEEVTETGTESETGLEALPVKEKLFNAKNFSRKLILPKNKRQIILFSMLFVAVGSASMSIYHAATFLIQGGKPFLISAMTSILLVVFASTGFTAARYFSEQKGFAKVFALPFILITSILICYIAFSTTSVSYEQFRDEEATKIASVNKEISSLELHTEVLKSIKETEGYVRTLERVQTKDITVQAFARNQKMLAAEREKLQKLRDKSYDLKEKSGGGSIEEKKKSIASVYDFLMKIFGIDSVILRFIIYVIPAVFYDIVAPFGFTVVFFLADNKTKEVTDEA